ncbi:auxin-responsive protein IAA14-like protein [Tanacetum coccineum]
MPSTSSLPPFMVCGIGGRLATLILESTLLVVLFEPYDTLKFALATEGGRMVKGSVKVEIIRNLARQPIRYALSCGKDSSVNLWEVRTKRLVKHYLGATHTQLRLQETKLCLGLPGGGCEPETIRVNGKRGYSETVDLMLNLQQNDQSSSSNDLSDKKLHNSAKSNKDVIKPLAKQTFKIQMLAQTVGWCDPQIHHQLDPFLVTVDPSEELGQHLSIYD